MPATPNIIDQLGTSWKLDVAAIATFSYQHPTFGLLVYSGDPDVPWLCDNVNTLKLTSKGTLPEGVLPEKVCIRPKYDGECGSYDLNPYNPPGDQCLCCDPGCNCLPDQPLWCGSDTATVSPCVGGGNGLDGVEATSGPTYGACATLGGKEVCGNWYCVSGQWKLDGYIDAVFCGTGNLSHTCCPLTLGTATLTGCPECDICVGPDCEPPLCCPDNLPSGIPSITADFTLLTGTCAAVTGTSETIAVPGTVTVSLCANNELVINTALVACDENNPDPDMLDLEQLLYCDGVLTQSVHTVLKCSNFAATPFYTETMDTVATDCCCNGPISFTIEYML